MRTSLAVLALLGLTQGLKQNKSKMQSMMHEMAQTKHTQTCGHAIEVAMNSQEPTNDVDSEFGHDGSALRSEAYPDRSYNIYSYTGVSDVTWERLTDSMTKSSFYQKYLGKNISLFGNKIIPHDVQ